MARRRKKKKPIFLIIIILLVLVLGFVYFNKDLDISSYIEDEKLTIVDEDSKGRVYALMIDNHMDALPHKGVSDAFLIYEIIVEGGVTRLMALFKDKDVEVGPIRSARPYFIDYALESDAIFTHFGGSKQAYADEKSLGIDYISGLTNAYNAFYRDEKLKSPHNVFTTLKKLKEYTDTLEYENEKSSDLLLNYQTKEIDLKAFEDSKVANKISFNYSKYQTTSYVYNKETKKYKRYSNDKEYIDKNNNEQLEVKNIIVMNIENKTIDNVGHQSLTNIKEGSGYYITNGYVREITWKKDKRSSKTIYKYLDNTLVEVNDGNTFIQIMPINKELVILE